MNPWNLEATVLFLWNCKSFALWWSTITYWIYCHFKFLTEITSQSLLSFADAQIIGETFQSSYFLQTKQTWSKAQNLHICFPNERLWSSHVSHSAGILFVLAWSKAHMSAEVVVPVLFKGQVSLFGSRHLLFILEQLNGDFWWVEAAHMTDERVGFPELSRYTAVHLNLWWRFFGHWALKTEQSKNNCEDGCRHDFTFNWSLSTGEVTEDVFRLETRKLLRDQKRK